MMQADIAAAMKDLPLEERRKLIKVLESRLAMHREANDSGLSEVDTAVLRGKIAEVKKLIEALELSSQSHQFIEGVVNDD